MSYAAILPDIPAWSAVAVTEAYPSWGGFTVGSDAGMLTASLVAIFTPFLARNTVPMGTVCVVNIPLYNVRVPVAAWASWWPLPVVGVVAKRVMVTGASVRVGRSSETEMVVGFSLAYTITNVCGNVIHCQRIPKQPTRRTLTRNTTSSTSAMVNVPVRLCFTFTSGCVSISATALAKITSGSSSF